MQVAFDCRGEVDGVALLLRPKKFTNCYEQVFALQMWSVSDHRHPPRKVF